MLSILGLSGHILRLWTFHGNARANQHEAAGSFACWSCFEVFLCSSLLLWLASLVESPGEHSRDIPESLPFVRTHTETKGRHDNCNWTHPVTMSGVFLHSDQMGTLGLIELPANGLEHFLQELFCHVKKDPQIDPIAGPQKNLASAVV